jgi:hypothetical protein
MLTFPVFNTVSLLWKQLDMNEEDILRITDELLLRRSFILETVLSFIYLGTILLILLFSGFLNTNVDFSDFILVKYIANLTSENKNCL